MAKRKENIERGEGREPEELKREIERTRAELGDTIDAITGKFSVARIKDRAWGELKSMRRAGGSAGSRAGSIGSDIVETIRRNPVPAAMAGIGILWLFSKKDGGRERGYFGAHEARAEYAPARTEIEMETEETPIGMGGQEIRFKSEEKPVEGMETGERGGGIREKSAEYAEGAEETAREYKERARGQVKEYARGFREYGSIAGEKGREAKGYFEDIVQGYPLAIAAFAFAIGAFIGFGVPESGAEREAFGEAGARLRKEAEETAREAKEEAAEEAKRAA